MVGNSWILVDVDNLSETFGTTFTVVGTDWVQFDNVWTLPDGDNVWTFAEATGVSD